MNSDVLAVLGLIGTFIVPFIVLYIERKSEQKLLLKISGDRKKAIEGKWQGTYKDVSLGAPNFIEFDLKVVKKKVNGIATYSDSINQKIRIMNIEGGFRNDRFLVISYTGIDILQFGTMVLELKPTNDKLFGEYLGFGHNSEKIVSGVVSLEKYKDKNK